MCYSFCMNKTIHLLRHCISTDNEQGINGSLTDAPLSETGKQQAQDLVSKLQRYSFDLIIVSPLQRTVQTINPYLETLPTKPTVIIEPLTLERDLGALTGTLEGDGKVKADRLASGLSRVEWVPPKGESILVVRERAKQFIEQIKNRTESTVLVVGHQNFLRNVELLLVNQACTDENFYSENPKRLENGEIREYKI